MPKRQATRKVSTVEIMGEDSFVVYRPIKVKEQRELMETSKGFQKSILDHTEAFAVSIGKKVSELTADEEKQAVSTLDDANEMLHFMDKTLAERIVDWNWVDDDDEKLPIPADDWEVVLTLYAHEYDFIHGLFAATGDTEKN